MLVIAIRNLKWSHDQLSSKIMWIGIANQTQL